MVIVVVCVCGGECVWVWVGGWVGGGGGGVCVCVGGGGDVCWVAVGMWRAHVSGLQCNVGTAPHTQGGATPRPAFGSPHLKWKVKSSMPLCCTVGA